MKSRLEGTVIEKILKVLHSHDCYDFDEVIYHIAALKMINNNGGMLEDPFVENFLK